MLVRVIDGKLKRGQKIRMIMSDAVYQVEQVGVFKPKKTPVDELGPGEIGFITAAIKQVADTQVGDTITDEKKGTLTPLPGFKPAQQVVFCGLFPVDAGQFEDLREALAKLHLNDASFNYEAESSAALGFGFRCGFLGLLHLEIVRERLERELNLDLITTAPSVIYRIHMTDGTMTELHNPADMPDVMKIAFIEEPWIKATIMVPDDYLGAVLKLCEDRRGRQVELTYAGSRAMLVYMLPLNEVVFDFYDRLKSVSRGYASFDYHIEGYEEGDLVKMSDPRQCRAGRCAVHHRQPQPRRKSRPLDVREAERADPAPHVPDPDPGGHRRQDHRPRNHQRAAQGRDGEMLWRRHLPQAQAPRQAERGQEEDAPVRQGRDPAGSLHRRAEDGRGLGAK